MSRRDLDDICSICEKDLAPDEFDVCAECERDLGMTDEDRMRYPDDPNRPQNGDWR